MFEYDYTLEESGVEIEEKSNKQVCKKNAFKFKIKLFSDEISTLIYPVQIQVDIFINKLINMRT